MPRTLVMRLDGAKVRHLIEARDATPTEVAARAFVSVSSVGRAMRGEPVGKITARAIARALGSKVADLMVEETESVSQA